MKKKFRFKSGSHLPSSLPDFPSEETNPFFDVDKLGIPFQDCDNNPSKVKEQQNEMDSILHADYFPQGDRGPLVKCTTSMILRGEDYECRFDDTFCFSDTSFGCAEGNVVEERRGDNNILSSTWKEESHGVDSIISSEVGVTTLSFDSPEGLLMGRDGRKSFWQSCSADRKSSFDKLCYGGFQTDDIRRKQPQINPADDDIYFPEFFSTRSWHEGGCNSQLIDIGISSSSRPCMNSFSWSRDFMEMENASSSGHLLDSSWSSTISDPLLDDTTWDGKFCTDGIALNSSLSSKRASKRHAPDKMYCKLWYDILCRSYV